MRKFRSRRTGRLKDQHVFESIRQMILPANDIRDFQIDIVSAGSHMVGRHSVAAQQRKVLNIGGLLGLRAEHMIFERNGSVLLAWHTEPKHERLSGCSPAAALLAGKLAHSSIKQPRTIAVPFLFSIGMGRSE